MAQTVKNLSAMQDTKEIWGSIPGLRRSSRNLEWVAMFSSSGTSWPEDQTCVSVSPALAGRLLTTSATWESWKQAAKNLLMHTTKDKSQQEHNKWTLKFPRLLVSISETPTGLCFVAQSCTTLCNPMACSPPGSSVHRALQARILEWITMPSSRGSFQPRNQTQVSCIASGFFTVWATREAKEFWSG